MTHPVSEAIPDERGDLWADELSDEALDRAAGQTGKASIPHITASGCHEPAGGSD